MKWLCAIVALRQFIIYDFFKCNLKEKKQENK